MSEKQRDRVERVGSQVVIYHRVYARESFDQAAQTLFRLVREAQKTSPGAQRVLYLDIDGHRNEAGDFDSDMIELQQNFVLSFLLQFLTEVNMPLGDGVRRQSGSPQSENIPEALTIRDPDKEHQG